MKVARVTNEKKNLNRLAGEFLVASRLTQRGYMLLDVDANRLVSEWWYVDTVASRSTSQTMPPTMAR